MANSRDSIRRNATDPLLVYDMETNLPIGQIINLSDRGFKLMTEQPMEVSRVYNCRKGNYLFGRMSLVSTE